MILATVNGLGFLLSVLLCYWLGLPIIESGILIIVQQVFSWVMCIAAYNIVRIEYEKERRQSTAKAARAE